MTDVYRCCQVPLSLQHDFEENNVNDPELAFSGDQAYDEGHIQLPYPQLHCNSRFNLKALL